MGEPKLRILGIYDEGTFQLSEDLGVRELGFDFCPRSANFFQGYRFIKLLNAKNSFHYQYSLHYTHESELATHKMLTDIAQQTDVQRKQLSLAFSDNRGKNFYQQFGLPFAWYFENLKSLEELLDGPLFKEIILSYSELEFLHGQGNAFLLLKEIKERCAERPDITLSLRIPWALDILTSIFDFFHFDHYLLSISPHIEKSYRLVDGEKLTKSVHEIRGQLGRHST